MMATALIAATAVCGASATAQAAQATPVTASPLRVLKPGDLGAYASAFAAVRRGDFDTADAELKKVRDPCLVGRVTYEKLMSPTYSASFAELKTLCSQPLVAIYIQPLYYANKHKMVR
jgi:hypothetical protein